MLIKTNKQKNELTKKEKIQSYPRYLIVALCAPDGDDKLPPRTIPEEPCSEEFAPEGSNDATAPWFAIAIPLV